MHGRGSMACMQGVWACMAGAVCMAGGVCGMVGGGGCMAGEMATAAGSTHPTGMHSCLHLFQHSTMDGDEP